MTAHARLANCDVALSFEDTFSILERLLPKEILLAAANAASTRRGAAKKPAQDGAAAEAGDDAAAAAAAAAPAPTGGKSLEALRAKADAELWGVVHHAEKRGSTFDLRVEVADWGLSWEPWRSKGEPGNGRSALVVRCVAESWDEFQI